MRGAQTIRRLGLFLTAWLALAACDGRHRPPRERPTQPASSASAHFIDTPELVPAMLPPVAQALVEVRDQKAEILAPREETQCLAFGKGRLAQASTDKVVFRDTSTGAVVSEADLGAVRALTHGVDGSLTALGLSGGVRLEPHATKPKSFPHVVFFPGAALFPDLEDPSHFYVYYGAEQQLFHYAFAAEAGSFLPIEDRFPLQGCLAGPALTRDGAFLCTTADGIERRAPRGREARFKLPSAVSSALRLIPAKRLDEVFSVSATGEVVHLRLQSPVTVLGRFQLPGQPFAAVGNDEALAFVLVSRPVPGSARHWTLFVTDLEGHERFKAELPSQSAPVSEDWLKVVLGDKNLAISELEPLVATGGADSVTVWDYARGAPVFTH
ncbi:MAG TPA: hypothetical protein VK745_24165 [Polyangiaceae bacterium]|nr:hypothetical protein [Polyangiaceae bacterium]